MQIRNHKEILTTKKKKKWIKLKKPTISSVDKDLKQLELSHTTCGNTSGTATSENSSAVSHFLYNRQMPLLSSYARKKYKDLYSNVYKKLNSKYYKSGSKYPSTQQILVNHTMERNEEEYTTEAYNNINGSQSIILKEARHKKLNAANFH